MKSVSITGYFATGSGAVYNLLQEYSSVEDGGLSEFEHIFLYDINGVFETVDRILFENGLYNSNAAINAFRREMTRLNEVDFGWFGGYKYFCGGRFEEIIEEFISDITEYRIPRDWYGTYTERRTTAERIIKDTAAIFLRGRKPNHNFGTKIMMDVDNRGEFSYASKEKLQRAVRKLISNYIDMLYHEDDGKRIAILNHMLSPQDAFRVPEYTPHDLKLIIVDRDIRDLYVYNKYTNVWGGNTFPKDINAFITFMKAYRATEKAVECDRIFKIQFEDLIYRYDETVKAIEEFVGVTPPEHIREKKIFIPEKSIQNTQVFRMNESWADEIKMLENAFPELIYRFPYHYSTSVDKLFDA